MKSGSAVVPTGGGEAPITPVPSRFVIAQCTRAEREEIYQLRHAVYSEELGQHPSNSSKRLLDALDEWNVYLVARSGGVIAGFISITPPRQPFYSLEKYFDRNALPFPVDDYLHEVRLITVTQAFRGSEVAAILMYAAFRWVESQGGTHLVAMGRRELMGFYEKCGLAPVGLAVQSGKVSYELLHAGVTAVQARLDEMPALIARFRRKVDWTLSIPFQKPVACAHGGALYEVAGPRLERLENLDQLINADVLDAWFPPAPGVLKALQTDLAWWLRNSPPADCGGLLDVIAETRGVQRDCLVPGAGSSDLIFRALREWLKPGSSVLILDPSYGEYAHVLEQVIGCRVDRLVLNPSAEYDVDLERLTAALRTPRDLVVLVNPNNPTGRHVPRQHLERLLSAVPSTTRVWVDETYIEFVGADQSLERFATQTENVVVCKSMSKCYALSGARVAYLCGNPRQIQRIRNITPPWVVSSVAQAAAAIALRDPEYYLERYRETALLRRSMADGLMRLGWRITPGVANFLLSSLPERGPDAATLLKRCRDRGLFLRNAQGMGRSLGDRMVRIAVKDRSTNERMISLISESLA